MHATYKGTLRGDRIEWQDDVPEEMRSEAALTVLVTVLSGHLTREVSGPRMAHALERLAQRGGVLSINCQWRGRKAPSAA
jgi:hypothetical protein